MNARAYLPSLFEELLNEETFPALFRNNCAKGQCLGVNLYEDDQAIHLEAPVPGIKAEEIKIFFDKGGLSIEAKAAEEKKDVKYHFKSSANYCYWVPLPAGKIDESAQPEAVCKDGILKVSFAKSRASKPLKIAVKSA